MRQHTTVRRQTGWQETGWQETGWQEQDRPKQDQADVDTFDDDLFVDGDERRRQRLLAIGAVTPEPIGDLQRIARASSAEKPRVARKARRRQKPAWVWALLGFVVGIGFWHAIGFWGFISQVVLPPTKVAHGQPGPEPTSAAQSSTSPAYNLARPTRARP